MEAPSVLEFSANFRRYTKELGDLLVRVAQALGTISGARVMPAVADELRVSARVGTIHYSNLIEGNELPVIEAERAARGQLAPDTRAKIELVNYVRALDLIDARLEAGELMLTPAFLRDLHAATTRGLGREDDPHFKPHHEGEWRDGIAVVVDRLTGKVMHEGPPADEVDARVTGMFEWLDRCRANGDPPFLLSGVMHYGITDIHPFADGNGRVARLFQTALLMEADVLPGRMFSFERYYAEDRVAYYSALRSVRERTLNMEMWLEYFLRGLAEEYERVAATVVDLGALLPGGQGSPLQLTRGQQRALTALRVQSRLEFTRSDYERVAGVSRSTAGRDLQALAGHGLITVQGAGRGRRYGLGTGSPRRSGSGRARGRPTKWTDAHIEQELRAFLAAREVWPPPREFEAAGKSALYTAASKAGGIGRWRRILGF